MPQIAETGTAIDFPEDAILVRNQEDLLIRVQEADSLFLLWERPKGGEVASPSAPTQPQSPLQFDPSQHLGHRFKTFGNGNTVCYTCLAVKSNEGRVKRGSSKPRLAGTGADNVPPMAPAPLPHSVIQSLLMTLRNAEYQALRLQTNDHGAEAQFFHGVLFGAHSVVGILCGALGYDIDFLVRAEGENHDSVNSNS